MAPFAVPVAVSLPVALLLAYLAPFGTDKAPFAPRALYWVLTMAAMTSLGVASTLAARRVRGISHSDALTAATAFSLLVGLGAPLVWLSTDLYFDFPIRISQFGYFAAPVAVISVVMIALNWVTDRSTKEGAVAQAPAPASIDAPVKLLQRLPPALRGAEILAVSAEDHYLRVHTDRGSDLILLRLSDAMAELSGLEGEQTHRSWWVARAAVKAVRRTDGRAELTLIDGQKVPVSRAQAQRLKALGWF